MTNTLYEVSAFTANNKGGNIAGVVLHADKLNNKQMLAVAAQVGFSETAFVRENEAATYELRFFTPTNEVDLCGHATIATWSLLQQKAILPPGEYTQQTRAGLLGITVMETGLAFMEQKEAKFYDQIPAGIIAPLLDIDEDRFHDTLRPQIVSTGLRDLFVPLKDRAALARVEPRLEEIAHFSRRHDISGFHVFTPLQHNDSIASARNFAPADGIDEEAATGTSNGALLCYLKKYGQLAPAQEVYRIEQGESMARLSYIYGKFTQEVIWIGGTAMVVRETEIRY